MPWFRISSLFKGVSASAAAKQCWKTILTWNIHFEQILAPIPVEVGRKKRGEKKQYRKVHLIGNKCIHVMVSYSSELSKNRS